MRGSPLILSGPDRAGVLSHEGRGEIYRPFSHGEKDRVRGESAGYSITILGAGGSAFSPLSRLHNAAAMPL